MQIAVDPEDQWKSDVCCPARILDDNDDSDIDSIASDSSEVNVATTTNNGKRTTSGVAMVTPASTVATVNVALQETPPNIQNAKQKQLNLLVQIGESHSTEHGIW
jgi:hypothetical protein